MSPRAAVAVAFVLLALPPARTLAQPAWPAKPVRMLVGYAPGGPVDIVGRLTAQRLSELLGQAVLVENRPGAGATIASEAVARAVPDGYTLLTAGGGELSIAPSIYPALGYNPLKDLAAIGLIASSPLMLVVNPRVPVQDVKALVALVRGQPGKVNFASSGSGSTAHLASELFASMTGTQIVHIPYKGAGPAAAAVLAGEAQLLFSSITAALPLARAGRVTALAMTSPKRSPLAPEVPTLNEQGIFNVEVPSWYTLMAPAKTSREAAERLRAEVRRVVAIGEFRDSLARQAIDVQVMPQAEFTTFLKADTAKYAAVVKKSKITAE